MESPNRFAKWLIPYNHEFENEQELINIINVELTQDVNKEKHADLNIEPILLFNKEKNELGELPNKTIIEKYLKTRKKQKVTAESLIRFKGQAFSVDPKYINCTIEIEKQGNKLYLYYQDKILDIYDFDKYDKKINYKEEHYIKALAQSYGKNVKPEDVENKALENLKKLDMIGGIKNDV